MRALFAMVAWQSAAIMAVLLISATAVFVWWDHQEAEEQRREQQVDLVGAVIAVTTESDALRTTLTRASPSGELAVHLADGGRIGSSRANAGNVAETFRRSEVTTVEVADGRSYLHPVTEAGGHVAIVEVYVPDAGIDQDAVATTAGFVLLGVCGAVLALLAAERRSAPIVRELRELGAAATTPGIAELNWRPSRRTPQELTAIAAMINRVGALARQLVEREHKMVADVSHRLRTPLTALRLDVEKINRGPVAERIRSAVVALEHDVGEIIRAAASPPKPIEPTAVICDLAEVVRRRMQFWQILADTQDRRCVLECPDTPAPVPLNEDDVADIVNNLVGNVFRHTEPGTPLAISVGRHAGWISLVVDDGGPGIAEPEAALQRGISGSDSTGLGLDIARTRVEAIGGTIHIERGKLGGARVRLRFVEAG
jgi:signal transduction histidine kinase